MILFYFILLCQTSRTLYNLIFFYDFYTGTEPFALSLLWPVRDVREGDKITRDFLPNLSTQDPSRRLRLQAFHSNRGNGDNILVGEGRESGKDRKVVEREIENNISAINTILPEVSHAPVVATTTTAAATAAAVTTATTTAAVTTTTAAATTVTATTTAAAGAASQSSEIICSYLVPEWTAAEENLKSIADDKERTLKVFCDRDDHLNISLLSPTRRILLVDNENDADVLYLIDHTISCSGIDRFILYFYLFLFLLFLFFYFFFTFTFIFIFYFYSYSYF